MLRHNERYVTLWTLTALTVSRNLTTRKVGCYQGLGDVNDKDADLDLPRLRRQQRGECWRTWVGKRERRNSKEGRLGAWKCQMSEGAQSTANSAHDKRENACRLRAQTLFGRGLGIYKGLIGLTLSAPPAPQAHVVHYS
jgi:hypothetical protein